MAHFLALFLIVVVPVWDVWYTRRLKRSTDPGKKIRAYSIIILWLWAASLWVWAVQRPGFLFPMHWTRRPHWLPPADISAGFSYGFSIAMIIGLSLPVIMTHRNAKGRERLQKAMAKLDFFLPSTTAELWLFAATSVTAGICEETLYRGFLLHYFAGSWGLPVAVALALQACAFGLAHGYQGWTGILATGVMGGIFGFLYLTTGSLLLPMVLHAAVDLRILLFPPLTQTAASIEG
jgi:membrane protease YdiL (CAAX protease family)